MGTNTPHTCIAGLVWQKQARRFSQFEFKVGELRFPIHFVCVSAALYHRGVRGRHFPLRWIWPICHVRCVNEVRACVCWWKECVKRGWCKEIDFFFFFFLKNSWAKRSNKKTCSQMFVSAIERRSQRLNRHCFLDVEVQYIAVLRQHLERDWRLAILVVGILRHRMLSAIVLSQGGGARTLPSGGHMFTGTVM